MATPKKDKIEFVSAICGSGKTYQLQQYVKNHSFEKIIIAVPSIILANEYAIAFTELGVDYKNINSENSDNVAAKIINEIQEINRKTCGVLVVTHYALNNIPYFQDKNDWICFHDEIPSIESYHELTVPKTFKSLTDQLTVEVIKNSDITNLLYKVSLKDIKVSQKYYDDHKAAFDQKVALDMPIIEELLKDNEVFTDRKSWDKVVVNRDITKDSEVNTEFGNESNKLFFISLVTPKNLLGFKSVVIIGANFKNSMLFKSWFEKYNIRFKVFSEIQDKLRNTKHENGKYLSIIYQIDSNWSKYQRNKKLDAGIVINNVMCNTVQQVIDQRTLKFIDFSGVKFLSVENKDVVESALADSTTKIPVISHGLNKYSDYCGIHFAAALNRSPKHISMLNALGFDSSYLTRSSAHETAYQAIMRTALRNPDNTHAVYVIVPDLASAEAIAVQFPGCSVSKYGEEIIKTRVAKTDAIKQKDHRSKKEQTLADYVSLNITNTTFEVVNNRYLEKKFNPIINITTIEKKNSTENVNYTDLPISKFIKLLKITANKEITSKENTLMFNGVCYQSEFKRDLDSVVNSSLIIMDVDSGHLTALEFHRIFTTDYKYSHVMMNSYSNSEEKPNRYRAIFFVNGLMNDEIHRLVFKYLTDIIVSYGYFVGSKQQEIKLLELNPDALLSGVDTTKNNTSSFFYMPSIASGGVDYSFFWEAYTNSDKSELSRFSLDVEKIILESKEKTILEKPNYIVVNKVSTNSGFPQVTNNDILNKFKSGKYYFGDHDTFVRFVNAMRVRGFNKSDVYHVLPDISDSKKRKDVDACWNKITRLDSNVILHMIK
jgi:hypothetical protein